MSKRRGLHRVSSDNQCLSLRSHILVESRGDFLQTRWSILPIYSVTRIGDHARTESGFSVGKEIERMSRPFTPLIAMFTVVLGGAALGAQEHAANPSPSPARQTESDEYTRYELLAPETASFKIFYEVTATAAGAKVYFNPIRKGSTASDEAVYDAMTGEPLRFEVVPGAEARGDPLMADADPAGNYIKAQLARPVPPEGQGCLLIVKPYSDLKPYSRLRGAIVFIPPLVSMRKRVALAPGFA